jgi:hypothetical protein
VLDSAITETSFTAISLTTGTSYKFKVQSRNVFDYSELSAEVIILAASPPSKPAAPVTTWSDATNSVTVSWTEPETNGANVLSYIVKVRESDNTSFSQELNGCDGSNQAIIDSLSCVIAVADLTAAPFSLPWGSHVYAVIEAANVKGLSEQSAEGNGALIRTFPDAPVNLREDETQRSYSSLGI